MAGALVAISALPTSTTIVSSDIVPFVKSGTTDKITAGNLRTQMFAFASNDPLNCGVLTAVGNSTVTGTLSGITTQTAQSYAVSAAVGKLVPGLTSFSLRNNADSADNLIVTDAGLVTVRAGLTVSAGALTMAAAASQLVPGATSFALRNNANNANNLIVTDAGNMTARGSLTGLTTLNTSGLITTTGGINVSGGSFAAGSIYQSAGTGLTFGCLTGSGFDFQLTNPAGTVGLIRVPTGTSTINLAGALQFASANSKIIPGATNISLRNNADGADNLIITDAGVATVRAGIVVTSGNLTFGTASAKVIPGATSFAVRNNADSADNLGVADAGDVTVRRSLMLPTTAAKIIPGATSLSLRNNGDTADNLLVTDAGVATIRAGIVITSGNLTFGTASAKVIPGATGFALRNNADSADNLGVTDAGDVTVRARLMLSNAIAKIVPGSTSLSLRNNADSADNLILTDAGVATIRAGLTVTAGNLAVTAGNLTFGSSSPSILCGGTALSIRNNANTQDNLLITNGGTVSAPSGGFSCAASTASFATLTVAHGVAPTSPVNGDIWTTTGGMFVRINGVTKSVNLT